MNQYPEIKKVLTENSLIDEIIYEIRQILKGIVVKDQERADNAETLLSLKEADLYHDIQMGTDRFDSYEYTYDVFMGIPSMTPDRAIAYAKEQLPIPEGLKSTLHKAARDIWLLNYEDKNNYYRTLWGKPLIGDEYIYMNIDEYQMIPPESFDITKPVHECNNSEAALLYSTGVIDSMKSRYPDAKYLDHLGDRSIDPYIARRANKFGLLYIPPVDSPEVSNKFRERYEINRVYAMKTIYSEAYHYQSPYYDRFIMMLIIIMTVDDMIVFSPEYIISRELFDLRTIQYLFEACGVTFFPDIPLKFQKRLIKNLNRLIKYKSSQKCMVDIVSLFGYDNMELFKYYMMKVPIIDKDGNYKHDTYTDPKTGKDVEDLEANYNLQMLKVPLLDIADNHIQDPLAWKEYEMTAEYDIFWNGVYDKDYVKHVILEHEFNIHLTKYISIDTVYSLTEMQFQMVYFINMLLYSKVNTDMLLVEVPEISSNSKFKLADLIIMLYALSYLYQNTVDNIIYDPIQSLAVMGFNFNTDLAELTAYIEDQGYTLEDLGLDKFINPNPIGIRSFEELNTIYRNNKSVYDKLVKLINNANNKEEYDVYRKVYESLYVTRLNFDMFRKFSINGTVPKTYTDYIKNSNVGLYNILINCESILKEDERRAEISRVINFIVDDIYTYIDKEEFRYIFNGIPTINLDYIRQYIWHILDFFKSYKVDVIHSNVIYKFDDRLNNKINIIDKIIFRYCYNYTDRVHTADCMRPTIKPNPKDYVSIVEKLYMDLTYWREKHFLDEVKVREGELKFTYTFGGWHTMIHILDIIPEWWFHYEWGTHVHIGECMKPNIKTTKSDRISIDEDIHFEFTYDEINPPIYDEFRGGNIDENTYEDASC